MDFSNSFFAETAKKPSYSGKFHYMTLFGLHFLKLSWKIPLNPYNRFGWGFITGK